jgi:hypothetical protein
MSDYTINASRIEEIVTSYPQIARYSAEEIEGFCCAEWSEGDEHQNWLDTAPAAEIGSWAFGGLEEARREREFDQAEARRYEVTT